MALAEDVQALTAATTALLNAVNVRKAVLDAAIDEAADAGQAAAQQTIAGAQASLGAMVAAAGVHAAAAAQSSTADEWTPGAYAQGAEVRSGISPYMPYRSRTALANSTTDPKNDPANWEPSVLRVPTGYPVQQPSGVFDFTLGYLPAGVSFSRASPSASQAPDGSRIVVGPNQPEFEYNAVTGECLGVVPRAAAVNLNTGAALNDLTQSGWVEVDAGVTFADARSLLVPNTDSETHQVYRVFNKAATAMRYIMRVRVKQHSAYKAWMQIFVSGFGFQSSGVFNPATGAFETAVHGYGLIDPICSAPKKVGDEWEIAFSAVTNASTEVGFSIGVANAANAVHFVGDGTSGIYVSNVGFWQGYPGQLAELSGTLAARAEDILHVPTSCVTSNQGAVYLEFDWPGYMLADPGVLLSVGSNTTPGAMQLFEAYTSSLAMYLYGQFFDQVEGQENFFFGALTEGRHRLCLSWQGFTFAIAFDGNYQQVSASTEMIVVDHVSLGMRPGLSGHPAAPIGLVRPYRHALTAAEMIAMTAGGN